MLLFHSRRYGEAFSAFDAFAASEAGAVTRAAAAGVTAGVVLMPGINLALAAREEEVMEELLGRLRVIAAERSFALPAAEREIE